MAKTLKEYLGDSALLNDSRIINDLNDLMQIIEPGVTQVDNTNDADFIVALILVALHKTTQSSTLDDGTPVIDAEQAVVSQTSLPSSTSVTRDGRKQIEHKLNFNVYTSDYEVFPIDKIV